MTELVKIGDVYATSKEKRNMIKKILEDGGLVTAIQSDTGLIIMEETEPKELIEEA